LAFLFFFTVHYVDPHAVGMGVIGRARVKAGISLDRLLNEQTTGSHRSLFRHQADATPRRVEVNRLRKKEDKKHVGLLASDVISRG